MNTLFTTLNKQAGKPRFLTDDRGAIMVMAVFMAAFLTGALWYIIGIGDAILFRETLQDGADAVAFTGAVYHAKGMNLIVIINMVMAAILAVVIGVNVAKLANQDAMVLSCSLQAAPIVGTGFALACGVTQGLRSTLETAASTVEAVADSTIPPLSKLQEAIAVASPILAEAQAAQAAGDYKQSGTIASISLAPLIPQERFGLPVQNDTESKLCGKAEEYVLDVVNLDGLGVINTVFKAYVKSKISTVKSRICRGSGGAGAGLGGQGSQVVSSNTEWVKSSDCLKPQWGSRELCVLGEMRLHDRLAHDQIMSSCYGATKDIEDDDDREDAHNSCVIGAVAGYTDHAIGQGTTTIGEHSYGKIPKRVFAGAHNGNGYFQVWAVTAKDGKRLKSGGRGVAIADWARKEGKSVAAWEDAAIAQAEFYYDANGDWGQIEGDAMWHPRWTARLRRVEAPADAFRGDSNWETAKYFPTNSGPVLGVVQHRFELLQFLLGSGGSSLSTGVEKIHTDSTQLKLWAHEAEHPMLKETSVEMIH